MRKRVLSGILSVVMLGSTASTLISTIVPSTATAAASVRQVEYLDRGLVAIRVDGGVYLTWRLLGTELLDLKFDIYRDNIKVATGVDATNYTDQEGFSYSNYQVVPTGTASGDVAKLCKQVEVWQQNYLDIPLDRPTKPSGNDKAGDYTYAVNDTSVADVDGDGQYEFIVKWDPSNSRDNSQHGYTGNVLIDCYEMDGTKKWRVDLGVNIRAGAHYTQFIVYDFDGDGKAEMALRTAPGSKDASGAYVSAAGTSDLSFKDSSSGTTYKDTDDLRQGGSKNGHIIKGPDWLTMFDGETGKALSTTNYYPQRGAVKSWGDSYGGRSERYLAGVAYLNGKTPSLIMCRGYYNKAAMAAYDWDGTSFKEVWAKTYTSKSSSSLFAQGTHSISVSDVDNDGFDEIVFGSAVMDHNGNVLHSTGHGHGDALHVSDFNNDGSQEIMMVHEESTYYKEFGAEVRRGSDGTIIAKVPSASDTGRGVMANIDDEFAKKNPNSKSMFWSTANTNTYDLTGKAITKTVTTTDNGNTVTTTQNVGRPGSYNSFVYWDGDLSRELLDRTRVDKFTVENGTQRIETFSGVHDNNSSKANAAISVDIFGDWREEVVFGTSDNKALRVFTTTKPTIYKLTTLMHDTQYRTAIAWQNVAYNQPPHPKYYIGSDSLATGKNYLAPKTGFDKVEVANTPQIQIPVPDVEKEILFTANSFKEVTAGFTGGTKATDVKPYNDVLKIGALAEKTFEPMGSDASEYATVKSFTLSGNTATAVIENTSTSAFEPILVAASYDSEGMLNSVTVNNTVSINPSDTQTVSVTADDGTNVKAMMWSDMRSVTPLTETLTSENPAVTNKQVAFGGGTTAHVSFDWKPGTNVQFISDTGENILTLSKTSGTAVKYASGTNAPQTLHSSLNKDAWYHVEATVDFTSKSVDLTVVDYTNNGDSKAVYAASFAGVSGMLSKMKITGSSSIDNVVVSKMKYNRPQSLIRMNVEDKNGNPVANAQVTIAGKKLVTDDSGSGAIKVNSGNYSYSVTKPEYKSSTGVLNALGNMTQKIVLNDGELRNIYMTYKFNQDMDIKPATAVGQQKENTVYTVGDLAKGDITYTFPTGSEDDELPPGYEDYAGQTINFEYDPNASETTNIVVGEGGDTYIALSYKEKRVPVLGLDSNVLRVHMSTDGVGRSSWTGNSAEFVQDEETGEKYTNFTNIASNPITITIPNTKDKLVMEYDIMYKDMAWGGNVFGMTVYNGNTAGTSVGLRASSPTTNQWEWSYGRDRYITLVADKAGNKAYKYIYNWQNQWAHVVLVCDGTGFKVTAANKNTGEIYVQDAPLDMVNGVGSASKPINKVQFGKIHGTGEAQVGISNFKAYTVGAATTGEPEIINKTVKVPYENVLTIDGTKHISDIPNVNYDASGLMGVTYKLQDENGTTVSPAGFTLSSTGVLTIADTADISKNYQVAVFVNGKQTITYKLKYSVKALVEGKKLTFDSGIDGATLTKTTAGLSLTNVGGTLCFKRNGGTAVDAGAYMKLPVVTTGLTDSYEVSFDYKVQSASGKGYLYISDTTSGAKDYYRFETHLYENRLKLTDNATNHKGTANEWYTVVMSVDGGNVTTTVYAQADTGRQTPLATSAPVAITNTSKTGVMLKWLPLQGISTNAGASIDNDDIYYIDNVVYKYSDYVIK